MKQYHDLLKYVLDNGTQREDRTGVGTISCFGLQQRYDLSKGFPAVTTKKLAWRAVVSELLWFIEGSGDEQRLREILHGSKHSKKPTIWSDNATAPYWAPKSKFEGDLGRVYGVQWRHWRTIKELNNENGISTKVSEVDQLIELINGIKRDPYGRRHILSAWNPGELDQMALPPCHALAQFYVSNNKLSCQMYQRSADLFLGVPFNIASYALLTHLVAHVCNLDVGEFIHVTGDAHLYLNSIDATKEQLTRESYSLPTLWLNPDIKDIEKFTMDDIKLINYQSHSQLKVQMAV
jgi:thymidylate synthase